MVGFVASLFASIPNEIGKNILLLIKKKENFLFTGIV